jgi:hypothetical protein
MGVWSKRGRAGRMDSWREIRMDRWIAEGMGGLMMHGSMEKGRDGWMVEGGRI